MGSYTEDDAGMTESYTGEEREQLGNLMNRLPNEFYGLWKYHDWEGIVLAMAQIVERNIHRRASNAIFTQRNTAQNSELA